MINRQTCGLSRILFLLCVLVYSSCVSIPTRVVQPPEKDVITASWYGTEFNGRPTSSGERYDMYAMTCAHKEFSFGTRLRVTYLKSGKSAVVTVNDRGPFIAGRDLDLSYGAALEIGLVKEGVGSVRIEYLGRDMRYVKRLAYDPLASSASSGLFTIQVGSFIDQSNALRLKQGLELKYKDIYITAVMLDGKKYYRVRIGAYSAREQAAAFGETLANEGYSVFITSK